MNLMELYCKRISLFFLLFIGIYSCKDNVESLKTPRQNPPPIVDVLIAQPQQVSNIVEANGTVVANEYLELHPEVSGRLTYLKVAEGAHVTKGTVLAKINDADLRAQLNQCRVQLQLAQTTVDRYKQLLD